jgi:hypothetical protein
MHSPFIILDYPIFALIWILMQLLQGVGHLEQIFPKSNNLGVQNRRVCVCQVLIEILLPIFKNDVVSQRLIFPVLEVVCTQILHDAFMIPNKPKSIAFEPIYIFPAGTVGLYREFVTLR